MQSQNSDPPNWSPLEIELLNTTDVFIHKPAIIKKAEYNLTLLKQTIIKELANGPHPCPPETDTIKGQIVRGENHKGFPFISLDMPQMFSKTQMFTFRTLFWWGHYLIFSLILKQNDLTSIANNLILLKESQKFKDVQLAISSTPWEWDKNPKNFLTLLEASEKDIRKVIQTVQYVKLCCFHPLNDPKFPKLNWGNTGLNTWRILSKVCVNQSKSG